ncbi:MAG: hypothetical protein ACXVPY_04375 [Bacteroidia bacterium]
MLLAFADVTCQKASAQNLYDVKGTVKSSGKKLDGAIVTLYKGSTQVQQITTTSNGRFEVKMELNGEYTLSMTKGGYITKKFYFNTKGVPDDRAKEEFGGQDIEVSLFQMPKDPNVVAQINSILSQPMAKFYYDDGIKEIEYDKAYSQSMIDALDKLSQIEKEANKKAEEEAKKNADLESAAASKYQAAIAKGDAAFGKKDYATAKAAYQDALTIKPAETYPHDQIVLIEKLIADAAKNAQVDNDYKAAIAKADAAFTAKSYDAAKASYNDALKLKPAETYPKAQLDLIAKAIADAAKNADLNAKYDAAIAKADKALAAKTYDAAKAGYNEALGLKPAEKYPKDKLAEIDKALADAAAKDAADKALAAKYDAAITKADAALAKKDYNGAKSSYNDALALKPAEAYPKTKLAEIDKALADAAAKDAADKELAAKYTAAITKADKALAAKDYPNAKSGYTEASGLKPAEQYPKDKLAEIDKALADAAAKDAAEKDRLAKAVELDAKYKAAITKADAALAKKDYPNAKAGYNEALGLKATEQYPKDKLAEIDKAIADAAAKDAAEKDKLAKAAELDAKYKAAITKADAALAKKDYPNAKAGYNEALGLKAAEQYPKDKLAEIDKAIADAAAKDAAEKDKLAKEKELNDKYNAAIAKGDAALAAKTYDAAKAGYNEALGLKPAEKYPKDKLAEIDKALADAAAKDAAEKDRLAKAAELDAKYKAAITKADAALAKKDYPGAKAGYNEALGLKAAEQYPKDKLAEIDKAIADAANDAAAKEKLAKEKELNDKYNAAIAKGDAALAAKTYDAAKAGYNEALGLKPSEKYPKDKLAEIDKAIADAAAKDATEKDKLAKEKELNDKYNAAIAKGDKALAAKDYTTAKAGYTDASGLKPTEQYPKDKLAEIDKAIADAAAKDAADKDKLAKAAELDAKYKAAVAKGDAALKAKTYDAAKAAYNDALALKSAEQYPKDKIAEIDATIAKEMGAKELDAKYTAAVAKADAALKAKSYDDAKAGYNEALGYKPAEAYPKTKLAEIDKTLADAAAKDAAEKDRLTKEKELNDKYNAAIAKGDKALAAKTYDDAKAAYNEALGLKATEKYPKDKIAEIDALLAKEMGAKELEKKYTDAIAKGDAALGAKDYTTAKTQYNAALGFKPSEKYPKDKLAEIDKALADLAAANKGKELEEKYKAAIAKADAALGKKDYTAAKAGYNEALGLKATEQYPKDKLAEIDKALADADAANKNKALDAKYQAAIAKADAALAKKDYTAAKAGYNEALGIKAAEQYPKDKLAEIDKALADADASNKNKALDAKYQAAVAKADAALAKKDYAAAKAAYNDAAGIKTTEAYPKDKLAEIDKAMADADAANKNKALDAKYQAAIAKADAALAKKDYSGAKTGYNAALGIKADEQYPKDKIAEIDKTLADMANKDAAAKEAEARYASDITKGDAALAAKDYEGAKAAYTDATGLKPSEKYPKDKLAEVEKALAVLAEANKGKELEANYKALIAKADGELNSKDYTSAKADYIAASGLKPTEQYPKDQVMKLAGLIAAQSKNQAVQAKYDAAVAKADAALASKDYTAALAGYKEANTIKPTEPYPTNKIAEINATLDDLAKSKEKGKEYDDDITKADHLFSAKDYKAAKNSYLDASLIKPTEKYPKDKIAECDVFLKKKGGNAVVATPDNKDDFKNDLAKKYPEGITEETGSEPNAKVTRRIVVKGDEGHLYVKKETSFGPVYFFKDGVPITEVEYLRDTEVQQE